MSRTPRVPGIKARLLLPLPVTRRSLGNQGRARGAIRPGGVNWTLRRHGEWGARSQSAVPSRAVDPREKGATMLADLDLLLTAVFATAHDRLPREGERQAQRDRRGGRRARCRPSQDGYRARPRVPGRRPRPAGACVSQAGGSGLASPRAAPPYLCRDPASSAGSGVVGVELRWAGDARVRLVVRVVCARAPSLTSVHDPGWLRAGDMMFDGMIPLGALRPLGLSGPSTRAWRREAAGSRPRRICVTRGLARTGKLMRAAAPPRRARAACGSCA